MKKHDMDFSKYSSQPDPERPRREYARRIAECYDLSEREFRERFNRLKQNPLFGK